VYICKLLIQMDLLFFFTIGTKLNSSLRLSQVRRTSWKEGMVGVKKSCEILKVRGIARGPNVRYLWHTHKKLEWKSSFKTLTDKHGTFKCTGCAQFVDRRLPSHGKKGSAYPPCSIIQMLSSQISKGVNVLTESGLRMLGHQHAYSLD
jgi:hypothetical protein